MPDVIDRDIRRSVTSERATAGNLYLRQTMRRTKSIQDQLDALALTIPAAADAAPLASGAAAVIGVSTDYAREDHVHPPPTDHTLSLAKLATIAQSLILGRAAAAGTGDVTALTAAQVKTLLAIASGDVSGLGALATQSTVSLSTQATGTLQAAQEPAHTGDVTNAAGSLALTIAAAAVSLAKMANLAANSFIGNNTGAGATPIALTVAQAKTLLAIALGDISGFGANVATALAIAIGSAGAPVVNGGALGTPSSGTLTNATGLPVASGISGLGASVATLLATFSSANLLAALTTKTGTGLNVFATSPALVTPDIGAATATSINFGGSTLNTYTEFTFTPTYEFATVGTSTWVFGTQTGIGTKIGDAVALIVVLVGTPTKGTGAGGVLIKGFPYTPSTDSTLAISGITSNWTWPASRTMVAGQWNGANFVLVGIGSAVNQTTFAIGNMADGLSHSIKAMAVVKV